MKGYKEITDEIMERLRQGNIPWHQTWKHGLPANAVTRKPYRGINIWLLNTYQYQSNLWLTYNQAKQSGGWVKRGEHGRSIVFWKLVEVTDDVTNDDVTNGEDEDTVEEVEPSVAKTIPLLRTYTVFNIEQTTVKVEADARVVEPITSAQELVDGYKDRPAIEPGQPAYNPITDIVTIPPLPVFDTAGEYYCTLFHELSHSTGHQSRLNRNLTTHYGTDQYAEEEVVAEMSASYLCAMAETQVYSKTVDNAVAYIQHWVSRFQDNERLVVQLSAQAQKASDWILGVHKAETSAEPAMEGANA